MDDENASCAHDMENARPSLLNLPVEIFLHICSFLDASTLVYGLRLVCKQFYLILKDDKLMWKARINCIWPGASHSLLYPVRPDKLFWMSSCVAIEKQTALWKQQDLTKKLIKEIYPFGRRALLLMHDGTTCIYGDRHGGLCYWKLSSREKLPSDEIRDTVPDRICIESAHNGFIFGLTAIDNTIYSCSMDKSVKSWMLTNTSLVHQTTYETNEKGGLTSVSSCPERSLFATGSYSRNILVFDSRSHKMIRQYGPHHGTVWNLAMSTDYILSICEGKMSVWDQRAGRTMKSIRILGKESPHCMSVQRDWVIVGGTDAKCHMLNPKNDFELVKSYSTEHTQWITGVHLTHGCLITCSKDGTVRISSPTDPPQPITTLLLDFEITSMDYLNDTLAIAGEDTIAVWRPKSKKYQ